MLFIFPLSTEPPAHVSFSCEVYGFFQQLRIKSFDKDCLHVIKLQWQTSPPPLEQQQQQNVAITV